MATALTERVRFARALGSRPFALLWLGQTISAVGDGAFYTAMAWQVLLLTRSGTAMGVVAIGEMLPRVLFMLVGGVAADRLPRRLLLLWSDAGRGVAVIAIAALGWLNVLQLWHLVALAVVFGCADGFFQPAYQALPPQLVQTEALPSANALTGLSRQLSMLVGPALGALLVAALGAQTAFAFDGVTFMASVLCLVAMGPIRAVTRTATPTAETGDTQPASAKKLNFIGELREGLSYVSGSTWIWVTIVFAAVGNVGWTGAFVVAAPKLIHDVYHSGVGLFGALSTLSAVGSILATLVIGHTKRLHRRGMLAYVSLLPASLGLIAMGMTHSPALAPYVAGAASVLQGAALGIFGVIWVTTLQELVPEDKLGRVSSIDWFGSLLMTPIGFAVAGVLTDRIGPAWVYVAAGALNLALTLLALSIRGIRELD